MENFKDVLRESGFAFKKQWGQNFLSDSNLLRAIVSDGGVDERTTALEIGTGAGALTRALAERAKRVVSYEIDKSLQPVLARTLAGCENAEVVFRDFARENLQSLEKELGEYVVVANLPYYITTPLVMRFVEESQSCKRVTVMVQEEVAERFCARAGTAEYGAVTAALARRGTARITRRVPKEAFYPRPQVDSAVVTVEFGVGGFEVESPHAFRETVRCAFLSRRKTLENNLINCFKLPRTEAKELLLNAGVEENARGETLTPEELGKLSDVLNRNGIIR